MAEIPNHSEPLATTPLYDLHIGLGAKMVPFAGFQMPLQYEGIVSEHKWTRTHAGLFDVSHMGQRFLVGPDHESVATALEKLTPGGFKTLKLGGMRYTLLLNDQGGIVDDLIVTRSISGDDDGRLYLVVNAARADLDDAFIRDRIPGGFDYQIAGDRALLALQGPRAESVLSRHCPKAVDLMFMNATSAEFDGVDCHVARSGYTGEDGFEISVAAEHAESVARALLADDDVRPVGLGARDSLRLEAGLPLYGNDLDETTSPVEAALAFAVPKRRRQEGGFPGAERILREFEDGPGRIRAGLRPAGRAPVREGAEVLSKDATQIGSITSGGFGPSVDGPVAMGYIDPSFAAPGTEILLRGRRGPEPGTVAALPFVPAGYKRKTNQS